MSEALEGFRDIVRDDLSPGLEEVLDQLEMLDRRSLIECEVEDGPALVVRAARGGRTIARVTPDTVAMSEPLSGGIDDPAFCHAFLLGVEERAQQLLRRPKGLEISAKPGRGNSMEPHGDIREHTGKYRELWLWLHSQESDVIPMTFGAIEEILGFPLPPSSRTHAAHWSGYRNSAVSMAIVDAGFRARKVDLHNETVELYRV